MLMKIDKLSAAPSPSLTITEPATQNGFFFEIYNRTTFNPELSTRQAMFHWNSAKCKEYLIEILDS